MYCLYWGAEPRWRPGETLESALLSDSPKKNLRGAPGAPLPHLLWRDLSCGSFSPQCRLRDRWAARAGLDEALEPGREVGARS
ncbi:hypothetical protein NDU88_001720 [Pleurodeles waltl]|uniref:Uncharacterized protein n=1 Tax=Pleurodeles waltl TaxID=8319 RepID=A0AAV7LGT4_PLEWA|nr:hypothetical protein NDU88_001720 [Pleurodeles waltl]